MMGDIDYMKNYRFDWEILDVLASGASSLDSKNYIAEFKTKEDAARFLKNYGYDISDPIQNAEMFGNFQESIQFIKRYFLKEGNPDGLEFEVPHLFYSITDISELLLMTTAGPANDVTKEQAIWAGVILKVMHTVLHLDKDIRYQYFNAIQTQIFDRFYRYLKRKDKQLFLANKKEAIPLVEFDTKSKKSRESTIIKLLHKKENVAEELFDRIGVRLITENKLDCLRVINFLHENHVIMANNIKPSRSQNSLIDFKDLRKNYENLIETSRREKLSEEEFVASLKTIKILSPENGHKNNIHSSKKYSAIHFTCRQLIKYTNPFYFQFQEAKNFAKETDAESIITKKLLDIDTSSIAKDIKFFYPFEVQVTDKESHLENSKGSASHEGYKKSQLISAMNRLFEPLIQRAATNK